MIRDLPGNGGNRQDKWRNKWQDKIYYSIKKEPPKESSLSKILTGYSG